jgi:hypothetical protein
MLKGASQLKQLGRNHHLTCSWLGSPGGAGIVQIRPSKSPKKARISGSFRFHNIGRIVGKRDENRPQFTKFRMIYNFLNALLGPHLKASQIALKHSSASIA